jgi:hypothetical protein
LIDIGRLKIVVGHQREAIPMRMQELDGMLDASMFGSERSLGEMLRSQVWAAYSGLFAIRPTLETISTWGVDRVVDFPVQSVQRAGGLFAALGDLTASEI